MTVGNTDQPRTWAQHSIEDVAFRLVTAGRDVDQVSLKVSDVRNILAAAVETEYRGGALPEAAERLVRSLGSIGLSPDSPVFEAQEEVSQALESTAPAWLTNAIK